jgi:NAD(P)-dependent dehydrogenase (short-subunit alcohol dehydrogenase family)
MIVDLVENNMFVNSFSTSLRYMPAQTVQKFTFSHIECSILLPAALFNLNFLLHYVLYLHYAITSFLAGGVVMFTRSLAPLKRHGVRVNVLCPEVLNELDDANYYYYLFLLCLLPVVV